MNVGLRRTLSATLALVAALAPGAWGADEIPFYVGRETCLECHSAGNGSSACRQPPEPRHLQAHAALSRPEAPHIAFFSGVVEAPTESLICLDCHSTGADAGPRWAREGFRVADGVQCEACHGAGSLHVDGHRGGLTDEAAITAARLAAGGGERACETCHAERTSHRWVLDEGYRRPPAQRLYKTPVNLAVSPAGDRLYVVCENSDSVVVVDPRGGRVLDEIAVGRRPRDAALHPDGRTLYVTNRMSSTLSVVDTASGNVTAEVPVGAEPHGVLLDAEGRRVFVLNTGQNTISILDALDLTEITRLAAGVGPWSAALQPDGSSLCVTNVRPSPVPFRDPPRSELTVVDARRCRATRRSSVDEANMLQGIAFVPGRDVALFTLMRTKNLVPISRVAQGWVVTHGLGVAWPDGRVDQVLLDEPNAAFPDPNDVAVSPDGLHALVTSGGSDRVAVVDVAALLDLIQGRSDRERAEILPDHLGTSERFVVKRVPVGRNPRGVVFSPDGRFAYVAAALDDAVTVIETAGFTVTARIPLGGPDEVTEVRRGERLFHSANVVFGQQFSCRSCHPDGGVNGLTFDLEGDGLGLEPVDNRTLQGIVDTGPFKWNGTNPTLNRECGPRFAVYFTRLDPFAPAELEALVRYVATIERPPNPNRAADGLTPAQRRGKMVFERTASRDGRPFSKPMSGSVPPFAACSSCHSGAYRTARTRAAVGTDMWFDRPSASSDVIDLTDDDSFGRFGIVYFAQVPAEFRPLDVPSLRRIDASAPYLHNGAAATLEEIFTRFNLYDWHGVTSDLTRRQFNDLIAYLEAL